MPRGKQTRGTCAYCGQEIGRRQVTTHLEKCGGRQAALAAAERRDVPDEALYHLRAQDAYGKDFWLDLEMPGSRPLKDLDKYLRAIWLECCGHMSDFSTGSWGSAKVGMQRKASAVFYPGLELRHVYDYGTPSETLIQVLEVRQGKPTTKHPIALLARNVMPQVACVECGRPATRLCMECMIEHEQPGFLCDEHAATHPHHDYGEPLPLVNSPRLGMCGYDGPAEPPY